MLIAVGNENHTGWKFLKYQISDHRIEVDEKQLSTQYIYIYIDFCDVEIWSYFLPTLYIRVYIYNTISINKISRTLGSASKICCLRTILRLLRESRKSYFCKYVCKCPCRRHVAFISLQTTYTMSGCQKQPKCEYVIINKGVRKKPFWGSPTSSTCNTLVHRYWW